MKKKKKYFYFKVENYKKTGFFSLVEWRYLSKAWISKKIHLLFSQTHVGDLITALTVGTLDDRMLKFDFGRLGLQHILAISGFHFGLLAFFLRFFFSIIFKRKHGNPCFTYLLDSLSDLFRKLSIYFKSISCYFSLLDQSVISMEIKRS